MASLILPEERGLNLHLFPEYSPKKYSREYSFNGGINAQPWIVRDVEGRLVFRKSKDNYFAIVDINSSVAEKEFHYSILSHGNVSKDHLIPSSTTTRQKIDLWVPGADRNDKTILDYTYDGKNTHIDIETSFYEDGKFTHSNKKSRDHIGIRGLDYASAIFQMILSEREGFRLDRIDIISKMGKADRYLLECEIKNEERTLSLMHEKKDLSAEIRIRLTKNLELSSLSFNPSGFSPIELAVKRI